MQPLESFELSVSGIDELDQFPGRRVSHVVSIIDPNEPTPLAICCINPLSHCLLRFHDALESSVDIRAPGRADVEHLIQYADAIRGPQLTHLLVHCHMGRSRSTAATAILLFRMGAGSPRAIFRRIASVRDPMWPNNRLLTLADNILNSGGVLTEACKAVYEDVAQRHPKWVTDPSWVS